MATPVIRYVYRANFCRFLRPLGGSRQLYSTESTPSVVETEHKELEVIDEDGKVKRCDYYHPNVTSPFYDRYHFSDNCFIQTDTDLKINTMN